jgi:hypothetical protein
MVNGEKIYWGTNAQTEALSKLRLPALLTTLTMSTGSITTNGEREQTSSEITEDKQSSSTMSGPAVKNDQDFWLLLTLFIIRKP